jgi:hypothetical protein
MLSCDKMTGSSLDDWILLALWLHPLLVTLILFPSVVTTLATLHRLLQAALHCTDGTCKSSNHMLSLHMPTSSHGSYVKLLEISAAFNSNCLLLEFSTELIPATGCCYRLLMDPTENTAFIVGEACLPNHFLAIEV